VIVSLLYQLTRRLLSVPAVLLHRDSAKDAELLVLRHQNAVLRRQITGHLRYQPADRFWFAALSSLLPRRRWHEIFPVQPATILTWHRTFIARKWDYSARRRPTGRPPTHSAINHIRETFRRWCAHDRSHGDVLAEFGPPSMLLSGSNPRYPKTLAYGTAHPDDPLIFLHLWNGTEPGTTTWPPDHPEPLLLAARCNGARFIDGFTFTPKGTARREQLGSGQTHPQTPRLAGQ
jgi:hypothetical protein